MLTSKVLSAFVKDFLFFFFLVAIFHFSASLRHTTNTTAFPYSYLAATITQISYSEGKVKNPVPESFKSSFSTVWLRSPHVSTLPGAPPRALGTAVTLKHREGLFWSRPLGNRGEDFGCKKYKSHFWERPKSPLLLSCRGRILDPDRNCRCREPPRCEADMRDAAVLVCRVTNASLYSAKIQNNPQTAFPLSPLKRHSNAKNIGFFEYIIYNRLYKNIYRDRFADSHLTLQTFSFSLGTIQEGG